ncbi:hypothetical protein IE81DRAFT_287955, partial [Ceraceosorus guamensis]
TVPVAWHIITDGTRGSISPDVQAAQMSKLNSDYARAGMPFQFRLTSASVVTNADWFNNAFPREAAKRVMQRTLKKGGVETLNIYTTNLYDDGLVGYSSFPTDYQDDPDSDGIIVDYRTVPGGTIPSFNMGRSISHETGHWVGLEHPFEGFCDGGDQVGDTPAEREQSKGCPEGKDTCPQMPGLDPIHNIMDYADDSCANEFTPGQVNRATIMTQQYRHF